MAIIKIIRDQLIKALFDSKGAVPREVLELSQYFRNNKHINFVFKKEGDIIIAISTDFRYGSIITSAKNPEELDAKVKDAILTAFDIPSSYAAEANIINVSKGAAEQKSYAIA